MDCETFALRKKFLEKFYEDRVKFNNNCMSISKSNYRDCSIYTTTSITFSYNSYDFNNIKKNYSILKPLIYYLYSTTYKRKFVQEKNLIVDSIDIDYTFRPINFDVDTEINVHTNIFNDEEDRDFFKKL